jgi:hypothetical protein
METYYYVCRNKIADTMLKLTEHPTLEALMEDGHPDGMVGVDWHVATQEEVAKWKADTHTRRATFEGSSWYWIVE